MRFSPLLILFFFPLCLYAQVPVNLGKDTVICTDKSYTLDAQIQGGSYYWSTDQTSQAIDIYHSGTYSITLTDSLGNKSTDAIQVVFLNEDFQETNNWLFGNQGNLHFHTKPDSANGIGNFQGGTSSISDPTGDLLFYTDGGSIYSKDGTMMQNGDNIAGASDYSSNSLIIPSAGSAVFYYVFTIYPGIGLYYSVVNVEANGGKGAVVTKNKLLDSYADAITAVTSDNGKTSILVHNAHSAVFYNYTLGHNTISDPVITTSGPVISNTGQIKVTPYGDKVALSDGHYVYVYQVLPDGRILYRSATALEGAEGVEFSNSGTYLYANTGAAGGIYQIDISPLKDSLPSKQIYQSSPDDSTNLGDLQLGIDGAIYVANAGHNCLGKIEDANTDTVSYDPQGQCLIPGSKSSKDLPSFAQHYFKLPRGLGMRYNDTCQNFQQIISAAYYLDQFPFARVDYSLDFGDGTTSDTNYAVHTYTKPGTYTISLDVSSVCGIINRTADVHIDSIPQFTPLPDSSFCRGLSLTLNPMADSIYTPIWSTGATSETISVSESGDYILNLAGRDCIARDTATITILEPPDPQLPKTGFICVDRHETSLLECKAGASFLWEYSGETSAYIVADTIGLYKVEVTDENGCKTTDSTQITDLCGARLFVPDAFTPNNDLINDVFLPEGRYVQAYELRIYDRWGELIFVSKDLLKGWDGTYRGKQAESGAYGYVVFYGSRTRDTQEQLLTKKGHLLLLR